jgi:hypothetical protein
MQAFLICVEGPNKGRESTVDEEGITIGSNAEISNVVVAWDSISPTHAQIFLAGDKVVLHNLDSAGRTFLLDEVGEKKRIEKDIVLTKGQKFSLGDDICTFEINIIADEREAFSSQSSSVSSAPDGLSVEMISQPNTNVTDNNGFGTLFAIIGFFLGFPLSYFVQSARDVRFLTIGTYTRLIPSFFSAAFSNSFAFAMSAPILIKIVATCIVAALISRKIGRKFGN